MIDGIWWYTSSRSLYFYQKDLVSPLFLPWFLHSPWVDDGLPSTGHRRWWPPRRPCRFFPRPATEGSQTARGPFRGWCSRSRGGGSFPSQRGFHQFLMDLWNFYDFFPQDLEYQGIDVILYSNCDYNNSNAIIITIITIAIIIMKYSII